MALTKPPGQDLDWEIDIPEHLTQAQLKAFQKWTGSRAPMVTAYRAPAAQDDILFYDQFLGTLEVMQTHGHADFSQLNVTPVYPLEWTLLNNA